jgi:hypothetical protein
MYGGIVLVWSEDTRGPNFIRCLDLLTWRHHPFSLAVLEKDAYRDLVILLPVGVELSLSSGQHKYKQLFNSDC